MAITNVTDEVAELRKEKELHLRIDNLSRERAAFCLKALLLAGHVWDHTMEATVNLAESLRTSD